MCIAVTSANRTMLGPVFTAIFNAIVANKFPEELQTIAIPAILRAGLPESSLTALTSAIASGSQAALKAVPGMTDAILEVTNDTVSTSYASTYAYVYYTAVALGGVSIIAAVLVRDFDQYLNDHVSRQIYHKKETNKDILDLVQRDVERSPLREVKEPQKS